MPGFNNPDYVESLLERLVLALEAIEKHLAPVVTVEPAFPQQTATYHFDAKAEANLDLPKGPPAIYFDGDTIRFSPRPDADGWIEWHGGECPVDVETRVDVRLTRAIMTDERAGGLVWTRNSSEAVSGEIVAYRIRK